MKGTGFWTLVIGGSFAVIIALTAAVVALQGNTPVNPSPTVATSLPAQALQSTTPGPTTTPGLVWRAVDQNIYATQSASTPFAENIFWDAWDNSLGDSWLQGVNPSITEQVWSPVTQRWYYVTMTYDPASGNIVAVNASDPTCQVEFSEAAILAYTDQQATAYQQTGNLIPTG